MYYYKIKKSKYKYYLKKLDKKNINYDINFIIKNIIINKKYLFIIYL